MSRRSALGAFGAIAALGPALAAVGRSRAADWPIGVCRGPDAADASRAAGVEYLEISCSGELRPDSSDDEVASRIERLQRASLPARAANGFLPGRYQATGDNADHDAILRYAEVAFRRAQEAGIRIITFGSSGARSLPAGFPVERADLQFVSLLARMAEPAGRHDVLVCVEPLQQRETNYINRVSHALQLVRAIDHPNIGITADIFHMLVEDEGPESIVEAGEFIRHIHIAEEQGRRAPGTSGEDFTPYLDALARIGYDGLVSIECGWPRFDDEVGPAVRELQSQIERAG